MMITGNKYFNYHVKLLDLLHSFYPEFSSTHVRRNHMTTEAKCPFHHATTGGTTNRDWWPNQLKLELLHQHSSKSDPMGEDFDYKKEFESLDFARFPDNIADNRLQLIKYDAKILGRQGMLCMPRASTMGRPEAQRTGPWKVQIRNAKEVF